MNVYVVVEGITETIVYPDWLKFINANLTKVDLPVDVIENNYYLIGGKGFPGIMKLVENAVLDINESEQFQRLVISVDTDDKTEADRKKDFQVYIDKLKPGIEVKFIFQSPCFEAWALGNRRIVSRNNPSEDLRDFRGFYDVHNKDPESLPPYTKNNWNVSEFAFVYLKKLIQAKSPKLFYQKTNPVHICHEKYYKELKTRLIETSHIQTFRYFEEAFT